MAEPWTYQVVEEPNPVALQERLQRLSRDGWEATSLGYAGECRLLALLRRSREIEDDAVLSQRHRGEAEPRICNNGL